MHYTSIENIHKVIDPLFLNDLKEEFENIRSSTQRKTAKLEEFHNKLASLKFLDPACGSGNFLTETYMCLRKLENEVIKEEIASKRGTVQGQMVFGDESINPVRVNIKQFYGIEINDFAVSVARAALWIAESQMLKETMDIVHRELEFLPLTTNASIVEANALRIDWNSVLSANECNYIMGNPPFVGHLNVNKEQKSDMKRLFKNKQGRLDYVAAWYLIAVDYIQQTSIDCAFVSTNSICQGVQIPTLWKVLLNKNIVINFAHRTFRWDSEANIKAHVHCVIIGFSCLPGWNNQLIFEGDSILKVKKNITPYLTDGEIVIVEKSHTSLSGAHHVGKGSQFIDGGHFIFNNKVEKDNFLNKYPDAKPWIFEYCNAESMLNGGEQKYCICLKGCPPDILNSCIGIKNRVQQVYNFRINSDKDYARKLADTPTKYYVTRIPEGNSILIPIVSSERRKYIPMCFLTHKVIYTNATGYVDNATLYDFGILISNVHMAWMKVFAGRLKSDYRYSTDIVYNTFPWPNPTEEQKSKIEQTAQGILDARALYPDGSLADLYDPLTMPPELRKAHQANDRAVMEAYCFDIKTTTESDCVSKLMQMYQELINNN